MKKLLFVQKIKIFFIFISIISFALITYNLFNMYQFNNNPLNAKILKSIKIKKQNILLKVRQRYNLNINPKLIISTDIPDNVYGLSIYNKGKVSVLLNKARFKENPRYMIDNVMPHEYAHALMFYFGIFEDRKAGHSKRWESVCVNLGGLNCKRFVTHKEVIDEKLRQWM